MAPDGEPLSILLLNTNRLITPTGRSKAHFLWDQAQLNNSIMLAVTESWLNDQHVDAEVSMPNFSILRSDRKSREGGGVALYLREDITGDILVQFDNGTCEMVIVMVHQLNTVVTVCYRPPNTRYGQFCEMLSLLDSTLSALPTPTPNLCLMGDFNLPRSCLEWQTSEDGFLVPILKNHNSELQQDERKLDRQQAKLLIDLSTKFCMQQEVRQPTHGAEMLDLVLVNNHEMVSTVEVEDWPDFSDHKLVKIQTNYRLGGMKEKRVEQYLTEVARRYKALNFQKAPWEVVDEELAKVNWDIIEDATPSEALAAFHNKVLEVLEPLVPGKPENPRIRKMKMQQMRRKLWKKHSKVEKKLLTACTLQTRSELLRKKWQLQRQLSDDYMASNKMEEDEAVLRIKQNPRAFFSFCRSRAKIQAKVGPFLDPATGKSNPSPDFAAECLRSQYNSVFSSPRKEWTVTDPAEFFSSKSPDDPEAMENIVFGPKDIEEACSELRANAAAGPDGVPAILLKSCRKQLARPLYLLWRGSMDSGTIPPELLLVLVTPVHKGGSRAIPKNYRPVALTSHIIKVFERVLRRNLVTHMEKLNIIPNDQHGSRAMRSTLTQLLAHWDTILDGLEECGGVDVIYLDFSKAFDKVEHGVLLHKLKDCKVYGKVGVWLAKFLDSSNRQQAVVVDGRISALSPVISGVPQGTVLGPILFLLHIADIASGVSPRSTLKSYVDDTRVQRGILNAEADCTALQSDLESIYRWAEDVAMIFNADKFEALRYWPGKSAKPSAPYKDPEGNPIEEKDHLRDLGVELGNDCSFSAHIENTVAAGNKLAGWALRSFRRRSKHVMLTIWKTMVQTKLDYCSVLWSPNDQASISRLESVARHFTAQVAGMEELDYWDRLAILHLYSQERRRERYSIIFVWKIAQQLVQGYNMDFVQNLRRGRLALVHQASPQASPPAVKRAREASLQVRGSKLFNLIPKELRDMSGAVLQFKARLDKWLSSVPDQPTVSGRQRAAQTNSLLDQVPMHHENIS